MIKFRLVIVGVGFVGIYVVDILLKVECKFDVLIDFFEQLLVFYGFVCYGVVFDYLCIKGIIMVLCDVFDCGDICLFGNVCFGEDIIFDDFKKYYNVVIFVIGVICDILFDIFGIDVVVFYGVVDYVSWFDGYLDVLWEWLLDVVFVGVLGNGNVVFDVVCMFVKYVEDLFVIEVLVNVYEGLKVSVVIDVYIFGCCGFVQVKFILFELCEFGELCDVDMVVYDEDFDYDEVLKDVVVSNKQVMVIDWILQLWCKCDLVNNVGGMVFWCLYLYFWVKLVEVCKDEMGCVVVFVYECMKFDGQGGVVGMGELCEVLLQVLYCVIGYFGFLLFGVLFDKKYGVIFNCEGQVFVKDFNEQVFGIYVMGWIKCGLVGLIGYIKFDVMEIVWYIINDQGLWWYLEDFSEDVILVFFVECGVVWMDLDGWYCFDEYEIVFGVFEECVWIKVVLCDEMVCVF